MLDMNKATLVCCGRFLPLCRRRTVKALCLIKRKKKKKNPTNKTLYSLSLPMLSWATAEKGTTPAQLISCGLCVL